jgi:hypothetical protein
LAFRSARRASAGGIAFSCLNAFVFEPKPRGQYPKTSKSQMSNTKFGLSTNLPLLLIRDGLFLFLDPDLNKQSWDIELKVKSMSYLTFLKIFLFFFDIGILVLDIDLLFIA